MWGLKEMVTERFESGIEFPDLVQFSGQTYKNPEQIGKGVDGTVYRISEEHVAKIPHFSTSKVKEMCLKRFASRGYLNEPLISQSLYDQGISVPKPEGIFSVSLDGEDRFGFVMEYIEGVNLQKLIDRLGESLTDKIRPKYWEEVGEARCLGFRTKDTAYRNGIWSPKEEKIYLVDFFGWEQLPEEIS